MAFSITFGSMAPVTVNNTTFKPFIAKATEVAKVPQAPQCGISKANSQSPSVSPKTSSGVKPAFQEVKQGKPVKQSWVRGKRPNVVVGKEEIPQTINPTKPQTVKQGVKIPEFTKVRPFGDLNGIFRSIPLGKGREVNFAAISRGESIPFRLTVGNKARNIRNACQAKDMRHFSSALGVSTTQNEVIVKLNGMGNGLNVIIKIFSGRMNVSMPGVKGVDLEAQTDENVIGSLDGDTLIFKPKNRAVFAIYQGGRVLNSEVVQAANERRRVERVKATMNAFVAEGGRWKSGAIVLKNGKFFNTYINQPLEVKTTNAWLRVYDLDAEKPIYVYAREGRVFKLCVEGRAPSVIDFIRATQKGHYVELPRTSFFCPATKKMVSTEVGWCWAPLYGMAGVRYSPHAACSWRRAALVYNETGLDIGTKPTSSKGFFHILRGGPMLLSSLKGREMVGGSNSFMASISQALTSEDVFDGLVSSVANKMSLKEGSAVIRELDNSVAAILQNKANILSSKPAVTINPSLTTSEKSLLTQHFPELKLEFKDSVFSSHPMCNAVRMCFNALFSHNYKDIPFVDIGGSISYHIKHGNVNAHCCNPTVDAKDAKRRESELLTLRRESYGDATIQQLSSSVASKTATFCMKDTRCCTKKCEAGFMVDVYDLSSYEVARSLAIKGVRTFDIVFMLPVELIARDGSYTIQELNTVVTRKGDLLTYSVGGTGDSYQHSFQKVFSLLTCPAVSFSDVGAYTTEYMGYRCGYHHIQMSMYSGGEAIRSVTRRIHTTMYGKTIVKAPFYLRDILIFKEIAVDTEFVQRVYNYALNVTTTFSERTFEYAMSSFRSQKTNIIVGTRVIHSKVDIEMGDEAGVVLAILIEALRSRRGAMNAYSKIELSTVSVRQFILLLWERLKVMAKKYFLESSQSYMLQMVPWVEDILAAQTSLFYVVPQYCSLDLSGEITPIRLDYGQALTNSVKEYGKTTKERFNSIITTDMAREAYKILKEKKRIEAERAEMTPSPVTIDELAEFINENSSDLHATLRRHKPFGGSSKMSALQMAKWLKYSDGSSIRKGCTAWFAMITPAFLIRPQEEIAEASVNQIGMSRWANLLSKVNVTSSNKKWAATGLVAVTLATSAYVHRRKLSEASLRAFRTSQEQTIHGSRRFRGLANAGVAKTIEGLRSVHEDLRVQFTGHLSDQRRHKYIWGVIGGYICYHKPLMWAGVASVCHPDMILMSIVGGFSGALMNASGYSLFLPQWIGNRLGKVSGTSSAASITAMAALYFACRHKRFPQKVTVVKNLAGSNVYEILASVLNSEDNAIKWTNEVGVDEIGVGEDVGASVSLIDGSDEARDDDLKEVEVEREISPSTPSERAHIIETSTPAEVVEQEGEEAEEEENVEVEEVVDAQIEKPKDDGGDDGGAPSSPGEAGPSSTTREEDGDVHKRDDKPGCEEPSQQASESKDQGHQHAESGSAGLDKGKARAINTSVVARRSALKCSCGTSLEIHKTCLPRPNFNFTDKVKGREIVLYTREQEVYTYGPISHTGQSWFDGLDEILRKTEGDLSYNQCLVQRYPEGTMIPLHSDNEACYEPDHKVLTVNLTGKALFSVKCNVGGGSATLGNDEWFVMIQGFQRTHKHSVISRSPQRISLTFRKSIYQGRFTIVKSPIEIKEGAAPATAGKYMTPHKRARSVIAEAVNASTPEPSGKANSEIIAASAANFSTLKVMQSYNALSPLKWMYDPDPALCLDASSQCPVTPNLTNTLEEAAPIEYILYLAYRVYNLYRSLSAAATYAKLDNVVGDKFPKSYLDSTPGLREHSMLNKNLYVVSESVSTIYDLDYVFSVSRNRFIRGRDINVLCTNNDKFLVCDDLVPFHDALNLKAVISLARTSLIGKNFSSIKMKYVNSPPGGGKTTRLCDTFMKRKDGVVIATANVGSAEDINKEIAKRASSGKAEKPVDGNEARTANSWIINPMKRGSSVLGLIDEVYLLHKGQLTFCLAAMRCKEAICYGDVNQIPFSNREKMFVMHYSAIKPNETEIEYTNISYRCPADVCYLLSKMVNLDGKPCYPNGVQAFEDRRPLRSMRVIPINGPSEAIREDVDVFLTYTQAEKAELIRERISASRNVPVYTIHEAQGKTFDRVALVRLKKADDSVIKGLPHALVGISRHTRSFVYMTYNSRLSDKVGSLCSDVSDKNVSDVVLQGLQRFDRFRGV
nr:methyl transferase/helicase [Grapevine leafroll-associated virus 13]